MRKLLSLTVILLLSCLFAISQTQTITGKITDQQGQPVPYATVRVKGSKQGASADADGSFTIRANATQTLIVSGTGFASKEVPVGSSSKLTIQVSRQQTNLSEVVVVGYGTQ